MHRASRLLVMPLQGMDDCTFFKTSITLSKGFVSFLLFLLARENKKKENFMTEKLGQTKKLVFERKAHVKRV